MLITDKSSQSQHPCKSLSNYYTNVNELWLFLSCVAKELSPKDFSKETIVRKEEVTKREWKIYNIKYSGGVVVDQSLDLAVKDGLGVPLFDGWEWVAVVKRECINNSYLFV